MKGIAGKCRRDSLSLNLATFVGLGNFARGRGRGQLLLRVRGHVVCVVVSSWRLGREKEGSSWVRAGEK